MTRPQRYGTRAALSPLLALPAFVALNSLPRTIIDPLGAVLAALRNDAAARGALSWRSRKAPMAAYWMAVAAHIGACMRTLQICTGACQPHRAKPVSMREQRNPIRALPEHELLTALPRDDQLRLRAALDRLRRDAAARADRHWPHAPGAAAYWRAASVYTGHLTRVLSRRAGEAQLDLLTAPTREHLTR